MEPILRHIDNLDWVTILLFSSLLFVVIAKNIFYKRFLNFIVLPFNNKYIFMYNKKKKLMNWFHLFFTVFQIMNFALFIFLSWRALSTTNTNSVDSYMYIMVLGALILFLLFKIFLQLGNGFIFGSNKVISELIFKKMSYLNYSGIIMFLSNIVLTYVLKDSIIVIYATILLILTVNVIGWVTLLTNHQKYIARNFIYFILYLCALEIAPFVIIGSYLNDWSL